MMRTLEGGLEDLSISRSTIDWGIPLPGGGVLYVWFDALINYISALGYPADTVLMERYWPAMHLIGKEIARFHTLIWPAMLWSAGLAEPARVFAHGWLLTDGEKMSKSLGNVVDPFNLVEQFGADAVRYFLFREAPFGSDFSISFEKLRLRHNSDLGNDLGNLLRRSLAMLTKYRNGLVPAASESQLGERFADIGAQVHEHVMAMRFREALDTIWELITALNREIDDRKPWDLYKHETRRRTRRAALRSVRRLALHRDLALSVHAVEGDGNVAAARPRRHARRALARAAALGRARRRTRKPHPATRSSRASNHPRRRCPRRSRCGRRSQAIARLSSA